MTQSNFDVPRICPQCGADKISQNDVQRLFSKDKFGLEMRFAQYACGASLSVGWDEGGEQITRTVQASCTAPKLAVWAAGDPE